MVRLWLVRHGETSWNAAQRFQGWTDVPLTAAGRRQARELRPDLEDRPFAGVWSSDLSRAVETARLAYGDPVTDVRLRELDFGRLEGASWPELSPETREALITFDGFAAPGGESIAEFRVRVTEFLDGLEGGDHLVVTHGGVVRLIARECGSDGFPGHASIVTLDWRGRAPFEP